MRKENHSSHKYIMEGHRERSSWRTLAGILAVVVTFVTTYSLILPAITVSVDQVEEVGGLYLEEDDAEYEIVEDIDEQYELIPQGTDTPLAGYGTEGTLDGEFIEDDDQLAETESEMEAAGIELWNETEEETETETEIESESITETAAETENGADVETGVDVETEVETETETETELKTEVESETEVETEEETDAETESTIGNKTRSAIDNSILASDGKNYKITVTYGTEAMIPEGAELQVEEILPGKNSDPGINGNRENAHSTHNRDYEEYVSRAQDAFNDGEKVTYARFFDITIVKDGTEIQPSGDVDVRIELADELSEQVKAVHFGDEVEVLDVARVDAESLNNAVEFTASGFSVFGVVLTETIRTDFLASDGNLYDVTVRYNDDAQIPEGSTLRVTEIERGTKAYNNAYQLLFNEEPEDDASMMAVDIAIIDPDGHEIEPKSSVKVDMMVKNLPEGAESEELQDNITISHMKEVPGGVIVETVAEGHEITVSDSINTSFEVESFSQFNITWSYGGTRAIVHVHYVDEDGNNIDGQRTTNVSYTGTSSTSYTFATYATQDIDDTSYIEARFGSLI